jgi:hypothetical protein
MAGRKNWNEFYDLFGAVVCSQSLCHYPAKGTRYILIFAVAAFTQSFVLAYLYTNEVAGKEFCRSLARALWGGFRTERSLQQIGA